MKTPLCILALALALGPQLLRAQLNPGDPLSGLERLKHFESRRASSSDKNWKNGNGDSRPIAPGGTLTIADLKGPGVITHIWNTVAHTAPNYSALLILRIYWDGEEHPSVECPLGDFFGVGMGWVEIPFKVDQEITAELVGKLFDSWDYGTYRVLLDGKEIGRNELYAVNPTPNTLPWGIHKLAAGDHRLRFECVGKPDKSKGYMLGFDAFTAREPVYARPEGFDLRKIQKPSP